MQLAECSNVGIWTQSVVSKPTVLPGEECGIEEDRVEQGNLGIIMNDRYYIVLR